jgi:ABC-type multidrug transport system fused ATPase/permease subunit
MLTILVVGIALFTRGQTTVGGIVMFMSFAGMLIQRLDQAARFVNRVFIDMPGLEEFFSVLDIASGVHDGKRAATLKKVRGLVAFEGVTFSYGGGRPAVADSASQRSPARPSRWSGRPAPENPPRSHCSIASTIRNPAR